MNEPFIDTKLMILMNIILKQVHNKLTLKKSVIEIQPASSSVWQIFYGKFC